MRRLLVAALLIGSLVACSGDPSTQIPKPKAVTWKRLADGSAVRRHQSGNSQWLDRCWRAAGSFDCLSVFALTLDGGFHYTATHYRPTHLAQDTGELGEQHLGEGFYCTVFTKLGLAVEGFSPTRIENEVSLIGEEPIGRPLSPEIIEAQLKTIPSPKALRFNCIELAAALLSKGIEGAASPAFTRQQIM